MERHFSNAKWEKDFSYARLVKAGKHVAITGTVSIDDDGKVYGSSAKEQAEHIFELIEAQLKKINLDRTSIIRTRMYITTRENSEAVGLAHGAFFKGCEPCTSMIVVNGFIDEAFLVEIEADAVVEP